MKGRHAYIVAKPAVTSDDVMIAANDFYWFWLDEVEETEDGPYTLSFEASPAGTSVFYQEEHKDIFAARYFLVQGDETAVAEDQIRSAFETYTAEELIDLASKASDLRERNSAIYQLGLAAPANFDKSVADAFAHAIGDAQSSTRIAAIWGIAYAQWPELRNLVEQAAEDREEDVRQTATIFLNAPSP